MKAIKIQEQGSKIIAITAIKYKDLKNIVRFTNRESSDSNPYDEEYFGSRNKEYYQRLINSDRVRKIADFIEDGYKQDISRKEAITSIFPTSMILAFDGNNDIILDSINDSNFIDVNLPIDNESVLIVDGQHRFAGIQLLEDRYLNNRQTNMFNFDEKESLLKWIDEFKFNCTLLIDFDMWEQAQLFANVNFYQKRVNKSLYYDIFGATPPDKRDDRNNSIYLSHSLVQFLNNSDKSPLNGMIKMLGTGKGYVSQAFMVEAIMSHFKPRGVWSFIEEDFKNKGTKHHILTRVFVAYFDVIKNVFKEFWPNENQPKYESILCKTTGMGALIRLLGLLYKEISIGAYPGLDVKSFEEMKLEEIKEVFNVVFMEIQGKGENLFGLSSEFSGGGSGGFQGKLYKRLLDELKL